MSQNASNGAYASMFAFYRDSNELHTPMAAHAVVDVAKGNTLSFSLSYRSNDSGEPNVDCFSLPWVSGVNQIIPVLGLAAEMLFIRSLLKCNCVELTVTIPTRRARKGEPSRRELRQELDTYPVIVRPNTAPLGPITVLRIW